MAEKKILKDSAMKQLQKKMNVRLEGSEINRVKRGKVD